MVNIKVIPGKFPKGGFEATVSVPARGIAVAWARTKGAAIKEAKQLAELACGKLEVAR